MTHIATADPTPQQDSQVAIPSIQPNILAEALRVVRNSASNGNTKGFMLAFSDDTSIGFSFLVCQHDFRVALYAVASPLESSPIYTCTFQGGPDTGDSFVAEYLKTAAVNMQTDYASLVRHFAQRDSDWRFVPWENKELGQSQDNYLMWRTRLWPWVKRIIANPPPCINHLSLDVHIVLLQQLRGHATEGMIVLDR